MTSCGILTKSLTITRSLNIYWYSLGLQSIYWIYLGSFMSLKILLPGKADIRLELTYAFNPYLSNFFEDTHPSIMGFLIPSSFLFCHGLLGRPAFQPLMSHWVYPCCYRKSITRASPAPHEFLTLSLNILSTTRLWSFNILSRAGMFAVDQKGEKLDLHHLSSHLYNLSKQGPLSSESPEWEKRQSWDSGLVSSSCA